jgi:uncharacterized membrane protein (DUF106 family)
MTLTGLPIYIEEILVTAVIVFITTLAYRFLMNQNELRELKQKMREKQEEAKKLQGSNPEESKKVMAETLMLSNKQLRMTMKPMMLALILFFIFLPFIGEAYGDKVAAINNNTTGNITLDGTFYNFTTNNVTINLNNISCSLPCDEQIIGNYKWNILTEGNNTRFSRIVVLLPFSLPYFENDFGWLAWYFFTSVVLNFVFRKILGVEL